MWVRWFFFFERLGNAGNFIFSYLETQIFAKNEDSIIELFPVQKKIEIILLWIFLFIYFKFILFNVSIIDFSPLI